MARAEEAWQRLLASPEPFTSQDFALTLGLAQSQLAGVDPRDKSECTFLFMGFRERNQRETEESQDIYYSSFCALFLPACVERVLDPPAAPLVWPDVDVRLDYGATNPWMQMLFDVQHNPYFVKYVRSATPTASPGRTLPRVLAERLLLHAPRWDVLMRTGQDAEQRAKYVGHAECLAQLLSTLLVLRVKERDKAVIIPQATRNGLAPYLRLWAARYHAVFLGEIAIILERQLRGEPVVTKFARRMRREKRVLDECGLDGCHEKSTTSHKLRSCAKCGTIVYCCKEHQQQDWRGSCRPHKSYCHSSVY